MNKDYLLEIGCEEIPARFMSNIINQLQQNLESLLKGQRFSFTEIKAYGTYRRLNLQVKNLEDKQEEYTQKIKGPPATIALDADGKFLKPAIGFAEKLQIPSEELIIEEVNNVKYIYALKKEGGKTIYDILPDLITELIFNLQLPIAMRWGTEKKPFIRPVHWLVSLYGKEIIPFSIFDITAGRTSYGHRFLTQNKDPLKIAQGSEVVLSSAGEYLASLRKNFVIVNQEERNKKIYDYLVEFTDDEKLDGSLLEEVTFLTEWPEPMKGHFSEDYLLLPTEILIQCMKEQQKYFPIIKEGQLQAGFLVIADNVTEQSKENIIQGTENVLKARFEDIRYFWQEDQKNSLKELLPKLKHIVFQKELGSIYDKVDRIKKISSLLMDKLGLQDQKAQVLETADFCKTDLVTHIVYELPKLQGAMGRLLAEKEGKEPLVGQGIEEHYRPRFQGDVLPVSITGAIVGLADKLDMVVCSFFNNLLPTGSQDPWGIRRAVYGILQIITDKKLDLNFEEVIDFIYGLLGSENNKNELLVFLGQRIRSFLQEQNYNYDVVEASSHIALKRFISATEIIKVLEYFKKDKQKDFKGLVDTAVRIKRLSKKYEKGEVNPKNFQDSQEKAAWDAYNTVVLEATSPQNNTELKIISLCKLTEPVTEYFDNILVIHEEEIIRNNRLAFLNELNKLYLSFADFEKIVI
ncbi:glycine--tRNA ligase subunit beta [Candidatus Margulisiibacteriota bacterium]